jgi:hypothetical protein
MRGRPKPREYEYTAVKSGRRRVGFHPFSKMLLSPVLIHQQLEGIIGLVYIHTAILISPNGQVVASASRGDSDDDPVDTGPELDGPERRRLLLGLAAQWQEDESPRVECEVGSHVTVADKQLGRLLFSAVSFALAESVIDSTSPSTKLLLVLNGSQETPWHNLAEQVSLHDAQY